MKKLIVKLTILVLGCMLLVGCGGSSETAQQVDQKTQGEVLLRAQAIEPIYEIQNFLSRKAINKWLKRVDVPNKEWYVYLHAPMTGEILGYYVSSTVPLSYGVAISNPVQIINSGNVDDAVIPAPSLDGVFYSGIDERTWYFFDAETDTLITTNMNVSFMDQPLDIDVPQMEINIK